MTQLPVFVSLIAALASTILGVVVCRRAPNRNVGAVFGLTAAALVCWNLNFASLYGVSDYATAVRLTAMFRTGAVFLLPSILHLCLVLPGAKLALSWRVALFADYGLATALAWLNIFGLLVARLEPFQWGYYSIGTPFYNLFAFLVVVNCPLSIAVLVYHYITTTQPHMRLQLKFWLLGVALALPLGVTNLLPSYGYKTVPLGNLGSAIWAAVVGYAIARHRLMDIELVVTRGLGYLIAVATLVAPACFVGVVCQRLAFGESHYEFSIAVSALMLMVGSAFSGLRRAAEGAVERVLFPAKVASRRRLKSLGGEAIRILDREKLFDLLSESVAEAFDVDRLALFRRQGARATFMLVRTVGEAPRLSEIPTDSGLARWLYRSGEAVMREEAGALDPPSLANEVAEVMTSCGWEASVAFVAGGDYLGMMALGRKRGLQAYSKEDLELLSRVAIDASVALQNARLFDELRRSREAVNRASRLSAIGTLAAGVAHEIRNPLVSVRTFFQLAPQKVNDEEFMTSFLSLAEAEVGRIENLVSELLTFAKSPSAALRALDLNEIVSRVAALLAPQAAASRVVLKTHLADDLPSVRGDSDQLVQVLLNLTLNGLQATPEGGDVTVETRAVGDDVRYCEISVADSGVGIPDNIRDSIFDPFFTTKEKGTGLGLAICHQIITEIGGFMAVESVEGKGSVFTVSVPINE